jgi:hypothetical protein
VTWSLSQLFPICPVPTCPHYGTRHMLPVQEEVLTQILTGDENYIYWQGGVGCSKTLSWGALAAAFMLMIPGSNIILFRKDYSLLYETLWKYFKASIHAACEARIIKADYNKLWSVKEKGEHKLCKLPNGSAARAGQLKNWSEFMGPSYDAIFISDAMETKEFGLIFKGEGVVGGLQSRLRGQKASFFQMPDGSFRDMRRFCIESNTPPMANELYTIFGKSPGVRNLTGVPDPLTGKYVTYRHIQTSNVENDHNPPSYRAEIISMHSDLGEQKRILEGLSVPYYGGVRCIKTFYPEIHVHDIETDPLLPLKVAIDPGMQHPAVLIGQVKRCEFNKEHFVALSEITNLREVTTKDLVELDEGNSYGILSHLGLFYPKHFSYAAYRAERERILAYARDEKPDYSPLQVYFDEIQFCIDRAGNKRASESKDRDSTRIILWRDYGITCRYRTNLGVEMSLDRVNKSFATICLCNLPVQLVSKRCELLIDGYSGGYRYQKKRDGSHSDKPIEDHEYEDIADAHRYCLENFFFLGALPEGQEKVPTYPQGDDLTESWLEKPQTFSSAEQLILDANQVLLDIHAGRF